MSKERITICGAGLVGSLMSIYLVQRGFAVRVIEKRADPRTDALHAGRSINLAISHRGLHALQDALSDLDLEALTFSVPMKGRCIHDTTGALRFQPYGVSTQHINSIGRKDLNTLLISKGEECGVQFLFEHTCNDYDASNRQWNVVSKTSSFKTEPNEIVIGADGAFSEIRKQLSKDRQEAITLSSLDYGYKELDISIENAFGIADREALHIWPRERFMLIALPNIDGSYTATLFLPMEGDVSFETLSTQEQVEDFFQKFFPDTKQLLPNVYEQFEAHPTSRLFMVHSDEWYNAHTLLIGDAAHALVPFYGQGMNAGFEDCRILAEIIDAQKSERTEWAAIFATFFQSRKKNADAISDLALQNFIEMRDLVADEAFLIRKKIEAYLHDVLSDVYTPQYTMVSFMDTPYAEAQEQGKMHQRMLNEIMGIEGITRDWPTTLLEQEAKKIALRHINKKA